MDQPMPKSNRPKIVLPRYVRKLCTVGLLTLGLLSMAVLNPLMADPTIYRCGPKGSQWFSQIPCAEDSEQVVVEDHAMFKETGTALASTDDSLIAGETTAAVKGDSARKAQAFITQLEKQRGEQLAEIDRGIKELKTRSKPAGDGNEEAADAKEAAILLTSMQNTRQSIVSEYDAMISAARQRTKTP